MTQTIREFADECLADKKLLEWSYKKMDAALQKGRDKGRGGWHDDEQCSDLTLLDMAEAHIERGVDQFIDAAVLLLMVAYRFDQIPEDAPRVAFDAMFEGDFKTVGSYHGSWRTRKEAQDFINVKCMDDVRNGNPMAQRGWWIRERLPHPGEFQEGSSGAAGTETRS